MTSKFVRVKPLRSSHDARGDQERDRGVCKHVKSDRSLARRSHFRPVDTRDFAFTPRHHTLLLSSRWRPCPCKRSGPRSCPIARKGAESRLLQWQPQSAFERLEELLLVISSLSASPALALPIIRRNLYPKPFGDCTNASPRAHSTSFFSAQSFVDERIERSARVGARSSMSCGDSDAGRARSARGRHRANISADAAARLDRTVARAPPWEGRRSGERRLNELEC